MKIRFLEVNWDLTVGQVIALQTCSLCQVKLKTSLDACKQCKTSRAANDRGHAYRVKHGQKSWQPFSPFFSLLINRLVQGVPAKVYKQGMQHKASQFTSVTHTVNN